MNRKANGVIPTIENFRKMVKQIEEDHSGLQTKPVRVINSEQYEEYKRTGKLPWEAS